MNSNQFDLYIQVYQRIVRSPNTDKETAWVKTLEIDVVK